MKTKTLILLVLLLGVFLGQEAQAYYNPSTGRWLSRDPVGEKGGLNSHGFIANDPVRFVDVAGLEVYPGKINCIGHACGKGGSWQPDLLDSLSEMLRKDGWKCSRVEKSGSCKCDCSKELAAMVYVYLVKPANWDSLSDKETEAYIDLQKRLNPRPFTDPIWTTTNPKLDVHAIRRNCQNKEGADHAWDYVPHDMDKKSDGTYDTFPLKDPDDYWKDGGKRLLDKQCCIKAK